MQIKQNVFQKMEDSWHKSELAGDAKTPGWDRSAGWEVLGGASCSGSLLIRRKESPGLCSGPECGPPPCSTLFARLPKDSPFVTSRGQTCSTEQQREGLLGFHGSRFFCCSSELKLLGLRCMNGYREENFCLHCIYSPLAFRIIKVMHLYRTRLKVKITKHQGSYLWSCWVCRFSSSEEQCAKFEI